jgi:hypothetical protein
VRATVQKWAAIVVVSVGFGLLSVAAGVICVGILALLDAITPEVSRKG